MISQSGKSGGRSFGDGDVAGSGSCLPMDWELTGSFFMEGERKEREGMVVKKGRKHRTGRWRKERRRCRREYHCLVR